MLRWGGKNEKSLPSCVQDSHHVLSASPLDSHRCFSDAASTLPQLDARLTQRQTSVAYRRPNKALMIRTPGRREQSAISRPPPPPSFFPPSLVAGKKVAADKCSQTKWVFALLLMSPNSCNINRLHIRGSRSKLIVTLQMEWAQVSLLVSYLCLHFLLRGGVVQRTRAPPCGEIRRRFFFFLMK